AKLSEASAARYCDALAGELVWRREAGTSTNNEKYTWVVRRVDRPTGGDHHIEPVLYSQEQRWGRGHAHFSAPSGDRRNDGRRIGVLQGDVQSQLLKESGIIGHEHWDQFGVRVVQHTYSGFATQLCDRGVTDGGAAHGPGAPTAQATRPLPQPSDTLPLAQGFSAERSSAGSKKPLGKSMRSQDELFRQWSAIPARGANQTPGKPPMNLINLSSIRTRDGRPIICGCMVSTKQPCWS